MEGASQVLPLSQAVGFSQTVGNSKWETKHGTKAAQLRIELAGFRFPALIARRRKHRVGQMQQESDTRGQNLVTEYLNGKTFVRF